MAIEKGFLINGETYRMKVYGLANHWLGDAKAPDGRPVAKLPVPYPTAEAALIALAQQIKDDLESHRYLVGDIPLKGTVRAVTGGRFIGKLAIDRPRESNFGYIEAGDKDQAYALLDAKAKAFADQKGFDFKVL